MTEKLYVGEFRWQGEPNNSLIEMWNGGEWVLATSEPTEESIGPTVDFGYAWALFSKTNDVRQELLTITDELEDQ